MLVCLRSVKQASEVRQHNGAADADQDRYRDCIEQSEPAFTTNVHLSIPTLFVSAFLAQGVSKVFFAVLANEVAMTDTLVIGGGVIGLMTAYLLARDGRRIVLVEKSDTGREASWAGGGIVSPLYPWRYSSPVQALARWSAGFYGEFCAQLELETGIDPEHQVTGLYWLDMADEEEALTWARREGFELQSLLADRVRDRIVGLGRQYQHALYMPGVANVRNPRLLQSLRAALQANPLVELREQAEAQELLVRSGRIAGARVAGEILSCDAVVLAAGAWSAGLMPLLETDALPVEPVKGQMILYKCAPDFLPSMILAGRRYAIPRRDGHVLVGSTLEHLGFDKSPSQEALQSLRKTAEKLLPALAEAPVVGHWAGLRPGSPEGIPFIGEVPGVEGLWLNCGHYRNGLVMAPASCRLLVDLMLGRAPIVDPAPYSPAGRLG